MSGLAEWTTAASRELGLDPAVVDQQRTLVLDLAKEVAHQVVRPGAPLTTYLLGVAVGQGADPKQAAAALTALAAGWADDRDGS